MKKYLFLTLAMVLAFTLAACGGGQGDQNSEPEITEPEHEHAWTEANYQEPEICTECGETGDGPIPPGFLSSGFSLSSHNTQYDYKTATYLDINVETIGQVTLTDVRIIEGDDKREAKEGYEWQIAQIKIELGDAAANQYGTRTRELIGLDYYDFDLDDTANDFEEIGSDEAEESYTVNFYGVDYEVECYSDTLRGEWVGNSPNAVYNLEMEYSFLVPVGYDGVLIAVYNAGNFTEGADEVPLEDLLDQDTLWFRLK